MHAIQPDIPPDARAVSGGCGATVAHRGAIPAWLNEATGDNAPDGLPYVVAAPATAAGFIFGYPLRAGTSPFVGERAMPNSTSGMRRPDPLR
jgi:hypothetical protein